MSIKEEINIRLYEHDSDKHNNFHYIWKNIAYSFTFTKKLRKDVIKQKNEYVIDINKNGITKERYPYQLDDESKQIAENEEVITTQHNFHYGIISSMFAVQDTGKQSNRYFIGFIMDTNILGIIVYFDDNGCSGITNVLYNTLYNYDRRNGFPKAYFYNQTLAFTQTHRDTSKLILGINLLDFNDKCLYSKNEYTNIDSSLFDIYDRIHNFKINNDRFIIVNNSRLDLTLIDMGSLKLEEKEDNTSDYILFKITNQKDKKAKFLNINTYKLTITGETQIDLQNFIDNFNKEPEVFINLEYPELCIMCNKLTDIASINYTTPGITCGSTYMGLGHAYCDTCKVRFSKTDNKWICCKLKPSEKNIYFCNNEVSFNNPCCNEHSTNFDVQIAYTTGKSVKYPFKRTINITNK